MTTLKKEPEVIYGLILREINNTLADIAASLKIIASNTAANAGVPLEKLDEAFNQFVEEHYLDAQLLEGNKDSIMSYGFRGIKHNKETE